MQSLNFPLVQPLLLGVHGWLWLGEPGGRLLGKDTNTLLWQDYHSSFEESVSGRPTVEFNLKLKLQGMFCFALSI